MSFQPNPGDQLVINGKAYEIGRHPAAQGLAYAQAGRQGIVYQLIPVGGQLHEAKALKVFFPKFRAPSMVYQSENMEKYSECQGLQVCKRDVLTPERNGELIAKHPDLLYAVIMPWVYGTTWFDMVSGQTVLQREESLALAKSLASIGSGMEQRGLAHCDLSAPNVLLPFFSEVELPEHASPIELVDVEQMYSPKMDRPDALLAGSPGYAAHRTVHSGLWSAYADRFAGAILLAEMLGWCDPAVVDKSWGESYFDQHEMQNPCERFFILRKSLERNWGSQIVELFTRAWDSQDLSSCPTFGEWLIMLSNVPEMMPEEPVPVVAQEPEVEDTHEEEVVIPDTAAAIIAVAKSSSPNDKVIPLDGDVVQRLFHQGRDLEQAGDLAGALEIYRSAHHFVENGSPMKVELQAAIDGLQAELAPKEAEPAPKTPFYRSKHFMIALAAALILVAGSAMAVNHIVAEQSHTKQQEEERLAAEQAAAEKAAEEAEVAKLQEEKRLEEERKQQEEQQKQQEEEQAKLAAQQEEEARLKEEERKKLQEKYEKQAKYEAYLAEQEAKKERQKLQEKYDKQAKYEAYLAQLAEKEEKAKAEAERKAQQEAAAAAQKAKEQAAAKEAQKKAEQERQAVRSQNVIKLVASYDQAYNAQRTGNKGKARYYGTEFTSLYEKDANYFKTVGKVSERAGHIYKMLYDEDYELPNL